MNLRWTDAGRAALADAAYTGKAALKLTRLALGDSHGTGGSADDSRTALRNERHRAALSGASAKGRIAARADFAPDASYGITEAGIFGTVGDPPGAAFLCLYWTDGGKEAAKAASGAALAIAATIEFQNASADVAVTVAANITLGNAGEATDAEFGSTRYATAAETGKGAAGDRAVTPKGLKGAIGKVAALLLGKAATEGTIYQLKGKADGGLAAEERTQDQSLLRQVGGLSALLAQLSGRIPGNASASQRGIVELATDAEAKKGADAARAVTPKAMRAASAENLKSLLAGSPEAGKKYVLEGVAGGGLKLVLSSVLLLASTATVRISQQDYVDDEDNDAGTVATYAAAAASAVTLPSAGLWLVAAWTLDANRPAASGLDISIGGNAGIVSAGTSYLRLPPLPLRGVAPPARALAWMAQLPSGTTAKPVLEAATSRSADHTAHASGDPRVTNRRVRMSVLAAKLE